MGKKRIPNLSVPRLRDFEHEQNLEHVLAEAHRELADRDHSAGAAEKLALDTPPPPLPPNMEVQLRMHESGDARFSWWHYPDDGEVLVFDAHGLTVAGLREYYNRITEFGAGRIVFIIHGGRGENPLAVEVFNRFCLRLTEVPGNPGISRIDFTSQSATGL